MSKTGASNAYVIAALAAVVLLVYAWSFAAGAMRAAPRRLEEGAAVGG